MRFLSKKEQIEFNKLLDNYRPNPEALKKFIKADFGVIAGPVAAGKDTLRQGLFAAVPNKYTAVISTTTRPPRKGEIDRQTYHFRSVNEVREKLKSGDYLIGALVHNQQVSTLDIAEFEKLKAGQIGLSILIVQTEMEMYRINPCIKTVFLVPPDLKTLLARLEKDRSFSFAEATRRLVAAKKEIQLAIQTERYYCLVSYDRKLSVKQADNFFQNGRRSKRVESQARAAMKNLLSELEQYLS